LNKVVGRENCFEKRKALEIASIVSAHPCASKEDSVRELHPTIKKQQWTQQWFFPLFAAVL
jgi:hypothetical protein